MITAYSLLLLLLLAGLRVGSLGVDRGHRIDPAAFRLPPADRPDSS